MHKDTPPYHPIHLPLNQEKCAIPIKEPKKKSGGGACLQYSPKTPAGVADVCICCVKKNEERKNGNGVLDVVDACFPALCCLW
jgi:hypothetical protein